MEKPSKNNNSFLKKRILSFKYAFTGIFVSVKSQCNLKIHIIAAIIAIILGFILKISNQEWLIISIVIGGVITAEMFNTTIEAIVDIISPEYSENAKKAKDISAGAILILAIVAVVVGIIIFVPKIILVINQ